MKPLERLTNALSPGATPVSMRRLKGGLGARMHVLRYETPSRERHAVVLRRSMPQWDDGSPQRAVEAFNVLALLDKAGLAAPKPLLLDAEGEYMGVPTTVLSYIPGRSFFRHADQQAWVDGLAKA